MPVSVTSHPPSLAALESAWRDAFLARTPGSAAVHERARRVLPGGDTRTGTFHLPYPLVAARGLGDRLWDVDGHEYIDLLGNFTSLVHGHAAPEVVAAMQAQAAAGTAHGTPTPLLVELAEVIAARVPSVERLRFCNSGTEATLGALRAAKAFTGRPRIMKMAGGYHGSHDQAAVGPTAPYDGTRPPGVSPGAASEVIVGHFNDLPRSAALIRRHRDELAAVIVEPMLGSGAIVAEAAFVQGLRDVTAECGVLLILDEIITLRLAVGGMQSVLGVTPDLSTFAKIIGGGFPAGAFGGRADVMATFDPTRAGAIAHSGTYNGNAATMAAGLATLRRLDADAIARLNAAGDAFRTRLNGILRDLGLAATVVGYGSLMQLHMRAAPPRTPEEAADADKARLRLLHLGLLAAGVFTSTRQLYVLSTAMTADTLDLVAERFTAVARALAETVAAA